MNFTLNVNSPGVLMDFLRRLRPVSNSVILEISDSDLKAKICNEERSVVKSATIGLNEFGELSGSLENTVKVPFNSIDNVLAAMKQFGQDGFDLEVTYQQLNTGDYAAEQVILKDSKLDITVKCVGLSLLTFIPDEVIGSLSSTDGASASFAMTSDKTNKLISLCGLAQGKVLELVSSGNGVVFKTPEFNYTAQDSPGSDGSLKFFYEHLGVLDKEDLEFNLVEDKLIITSQASVAIISEATDASEG